jgi:hypothetical protein
MSKIRYISLVITIVIIGFLAYFSPTQNEKATKPIIGRLKNISYSKQQSGEKTLLTNLHFISGELNVSPIQNNNLYEFQAFYKLREYKPVIVFSSGKTSSLEIKLDQYEKFGLSARSNWNLGLNQDIEHDLTIESRASKINLDLSYIPIKHLELKTGASQIKMYFGLPNKTIMRKLRIDARASDCKLYGLSNARAKQIEIFSGTGQYILDFSGNQSVSTNVRIDGAISKAKLIIPKSVNTIIMFKDKMFTGINIKGFIKRSPNTYVSNNYDPYGIILNINISLGTGLLSVISE